MITKEQLLEILPEAIHCPFGVDALVPVLNNIETQLGEGKYRLPMFLAQIATESNQFMFVVEDLDYSAEALLRVFPREFPTSELANAYARIPEKIANRVYANRMGNGDEASGDGWKYRGRGFIQITGKDNYTAICNSLCINSINNPDLLATLPYAMDSALWYWNQNNLNEAADRQDVVLATRRINGGLNGLTQREMYYSKARKVLLGE